MTAAMSASALRILMMKGGVTRGVPFGFHALQRSLAELHWSAYPHMPVLRLQPVDVRVQGANPGLEQGFLSPLPPRRWGQQATESSCCAPVSPHKQLQGNGWQLLCEKTSHNQGHGEKGRRLRGSPGFDLRSLPLDDIV